MKSVKAWRHAEEMLTVGELKRVLATLKDDQAVIGVVHSKFGPGQTVIQSVELTPPWHGAKPDRSNYLLTLHISEDNSLILEDLPHPLFQPSTLSPLPSSAASAARLDQTD